MEHIVKLAEFNGTEIVESEYREEIIRCRDCKYLNKDGECENEQWATDDYSCIRPYVLGANGWSGFCAWAERTE